MGAIAADWEGLGIWLSWQRSTFELRRGDTASSPTTRDDALLAATSFVMEGSPPPHSQSSRLFSSPFPTLLAASQSQHLAHCSAVEANSPFVGPPLSTTRALGPAALGCTSLHLRGEGFNLGNTRRLNNCIPSRLARAITQPLFRLLEFSCLPSASFVVLVLAL